MPYRSVPELLASPGDTAAGTTHARAALDALPPESLTLRLLMTELEES
ncbi:hypothetical protein [Streptomyces sp. XY413]|nr:hypothetical protein [Streptomyces sp. XY413]